MHGEGGLDADDDDGDDAAKMEDGDHDADE